VQRIIGKLDTYLGEDFVADDVASGKPTILRKGMGVHNFDE